MHSDGKIYVAGHTGLVGSALMRCLGKSGYTNIITRMQAELDLTDPKATDAFFDKEKPEYVFLAAAKVGGIAANNRFPADFIRINLQIELNVIDAAYRHGVKKLLFLGSSCIYPKLAPQPITEDCLLTGILEPTNDAYAIAKIAGIMLCRSYNRQHGTNFIAAMPTNLYGPNDNFDLQSSHVVPALIRKFHEAEQRGDKTVELWGSGTPMRELLFVDDLAEALLFLMDRFDTSPAFPDNIVINVGTGDDVTIRKLAGLIKDMVGYNGKIFWDTDMPDGTPRKVLDVSKLTDLGWKAKTVLNEGLRQTYTWYLSARIRESNQ